MNYDHKKTLVANRVCDLLLKEGYDPGDGACLLVGTAVALVKMYSRDMAHCQVSYRLLRQVMEEYIKAVELDIDCSDVD